MFDGQIAYDLEEFCNDDGNPCGQSFTFEVTCDAVKYVCVDLLGTVGADKVVFELNSELNSKDQVCTRKARSAHVRLVELPTDLISTSKAFWTAMADANYRVIRRGDDDFAVEVTRIGALPQTAASFATEAEADAWIVQDKRLWEAADPFRTPAARRQRRF
jgi:hypothetical protein